MFTEKVANFLLQMGEWFVVILLGLILLGGIALGISAVIYYIKKYFKT